MGTLIFGSLRAWTVISRAIGKPSTLVESWSIPGFRCLHFVAMSKRLETARNGSVVVAKTRCWRSLESAGF